MKSFFSNKKYWPVFIILSAIVISIFMIIAKPELDTKPTVIQLPNVSVIEVAEETRTLMINAQGTVVPRSETNLIPEVNGKITWMSPAFVAGGFIEQDQELLRIDSADYLDAKGLAEASLAKAEVEADLALSELKRLKQLRKKNLSSQSQLDQAQRTAKVAQASLKDAQIKLQQAQRDLGRTTLKAPFTGRIRSEAVDVGQFVSRGENIGTVYATDYVEIRLPIVDSKLAYLDLPLGYSGNLAYEQQSNVLVSGEYAGQQHQWQGKLVRTEAELDINSRMVYGVVRVENKIQSGAVPLMVGMFVDATIEGKIVNNVVELPRIALRDGNQVLVLDENNTLRFRKVIPLRIERNTVLIADGLESGEKVCTSSIVFAVDGIKVNPLLKKV